MYKPPSILSVSASPSWCEVQIFAFTGVGASLCLVGSGGAPFRSGGAPFRRLADLKHQGLGLAHWGVDGGPAWCKKDALRRVRTGRARAHASRALAGTHVNADARASAHARTHAPARARTHPRTHTHTHAVTFDALVTTPMTIETSPGTSPIFAKVFSLQSSVSLAHFLLPPFLQRLVGVPLAGLMGNST